MRFVTLVNNSLPERNPLKTIQNQGIGLRVRYSALGISQRSSQNSGGDGGNYYNP
jgi:hypothetical protein